MAAYAFTDNFENMVQVAELNKANSFTGVQTFTGNVESTSKTNGTVVITGKMQDPIRFGIELKAK